MKTKYIIICLIGIMFLSGTIRAFGFFNIDGSTRWNYLRNIDSYFFSKNTQLIIDNSFNINFVDNTVLSPNGGNFIVGQFVYPYITAVFYVLVNSFYHIPLEYFMSWFVVLIASLVVIPAYFIGKALWNKRAGLLTALFMVLAPPFVARSLGGDPDSDAFVMLIMMLSVMMVVFMIKYINKEKIMCKRNLILGITSGIIFSIFAYSWSGFWFSFMLLYTFIFFAIVIKFIYVRKLNVVKEYYSLIVMFLIAWGIFALAVFPIYSIGYSLSPITTPLSLGGSFKGDIGVASIGSFFPNVAISIAELQGVGNAQAALLSTAGVDSAVVATGLPMSLLTILSPLVITLVCFGLLFIKRKEHFDIMLFLGLWFILFTIASVIAIRFTIFVAPVFAICSAIFFVFVWDKIGERFAQKSS